MSAVVPTTSEASAGTKAAPLSYRALIAYCALTGVVGGVVATVYYYVLHGCIALVWDWLAPAVRAAVPAAGAHSVWIVTTIGGLLVGLCVRFLGTPGEISAVVNNLHLEHGRLDVRQNPTMIATSLVSISFGGSGGPEAPLVQIVGSIGSWIADRLRLAPSQIRMLTFSGMAAALGAFFGAPLGGALFALEIPHRRGLEYYEALVPSIVAATISYFMFHSIVGYETPLYDFGVAIDVSALAMVQAVALGAVGAAVGSLFVVTFRLVGGAAKRLGRAPVLRATLGGMAIGGIASALPGDFPVTTLFWGEYQIRDIIAAHGTLASHYGLAAAVMMLGGLALLKMLAIGFTLNSGFRGGFIFPLFFLGAAVGLAISLATDGTVALPVAMLCTMAAVNVAVTKTPVSTAVILTSASAMPLLPVIVAASLTSFLLTTQVTLIATQRSRRTAIPASTSAHTTELP